MMRMLETLAPWLGRGLMAAALLLNLVSYLSWGRAVTVGELSQYVRNHAVRELVYGLGLTGLSVLALLQPERSGGRVVLALASGASVLGFWIGLIALGGLSGISRVFPGQSARYALSLHVPQLVLWALGLALLWRQHAP